jgi:hypothetical protein
MQLEKVLYKWFTAMCPEGQPVTWPTIIEKATSFYDDMDVINKCTLWPGCKI